MTNLRLGSVTGGQFDFIEYEIGMWIFQGCGFMDWLQKKLIQGDLYKSLHNSHPES